MDDDTKQALANYSKFKASSFDTFRRFIKELERDPAIDETLAKR